MTIRPALPAHPTLDGVHLVEADTSSWEIAPREISTVHRMATGKRRKHYHWAGPGLPDRVRKLDVRLGWDSLGSMRTTVEELLAVPGTHELILWRQEPDAWIAPGGVAEFTLPRRLAVDVISTAPDGLLLSRFNPQVKVGRSGVDLTYVSKSTGAYGTGSPASGEAWFLAGGTTFRLAAAPAAGEVVYAWTVPVFVVIEGDLSTKQFQSPLAEPLKLSLEEAD